MKHLKYLIITFSLFLIIILFQGGIKVNALSKPVYHIVTTSGENSSHEITINWHSEKSGSYCLLTLESDTLFNNAVKIMPTEENLWSTEDTYNATKSDSFATIKRYVCYLELKDLNPRTKYCYKIVLGDYESEVHRFLTAGLTSEWQFLGFCDFQSHYNTMVHTLVNKLYKDFGRPPLVICSGDLVDTGAFEKEWSHLFDDYNTFNDFIFMSAPGDHEYHGDGTSPVPMMKNADTFNNFLKNPSNGASLSKNTSYYFYYNNVLFVSLDFLDSNTVSNDKINEEVTWFKETIKSLEGTFQYLIVFEHKSIYGSTSIDSSVSKRIKPQWYPVFDECGVDLVLSGHDHEYSRTYKLYNNKISNDETKGTYYLDLGSSGNKRRDLDGTTSSDGLHEEVLDIKNMNISLGALFDVNENRIVVSCIDQNGDTQDFFVIKPKRSALELGKLDFDVNKFTSDINIELTDFDNHKGILKLNDSSELKYVKKIKLTSKRNILNEDIKYTDLSSSYELNNISTNTITISVTLLDNTVVEIEKNILPVGEISNLEVILNNNYSLKFNNNIKSYTDLDYFLTIDGKKISLLSFDNLTEGLVNVDLEYLKKDFNIGIEVFDKDNLIKKYELNVLKKCDEYLILDKEIIDIEIGKTLLLIPKIGKVIDKIDEVICINDGVLKVTGYGESDIVLKIGDDEIIYHLKTEEQEVTNPTEVTEPDEEIEPATDITEPDEKVTDIKPNSTSENKSGCKSLSIIKMLSMLSAIGLIFIFRKLYQKII